MRVEARSMRLYDVERQIVGEVAEVMSRSASTAASLAKQLAPKRTGRLRLSIAIEQRGEIRFRIVAGAPYAAHVEFGTIYMDGFFYMTRAIAEARKQAFEELARIKGRIR